MKILVFYSGGKDSHACLLWACKKYGNKNIQAVFCDTMWENPLTYQHIEETTKKLNVELVVLKSDKYEGFIDMAAKKGRFPSTKARFCTEELKSKPAIDYVLSLNDNVIAIQGIRKDESFSRSKMESQCTYFKFYFQPYSLDKQGKPKYHTYRKKDIIEYCKKFNADIERPIFDWTAQQTIDYINASGHYPNPLYSLGFSRVGCFPCIMSRHHEVLQIVKNFPNEWKLIEDAEILTKRSFFPPDYIPSWAQTGRDKDNKSFSKANDVKKYLLDKNATGDLFKDESEGFSCMSFYGLCE
jgi:3'-phosphoadenosine 5'-phosphosulfate sulfotransferase (PAPS reductase)/FAD synthetase